jgi:hypothetical protein
LIETTNDPMVVIGVEDMDAALDRAVKQLLQAEWEVAMLRANSTNQSVDLISRPSLTRDGDETHLS